MKKKENLWELLKRLDEEAGQFNTHLHKANRYFEVVSHKTEKVLKEHEKQLHKTIASVRKALRSFLKQKDKKE